MLLTPGAVLGFLRMLLADSKVALNTIEHLLLFFLFLGCGLRFTAFWRLGGLRCGLRVSVFCLDFTGHGLSCQVDIHVELINSVADLLALIIGLATMLCYSLLGR